MEINYRTKEESKKAQKEAFLKLTGAERILKFLELQEAISLFPTKAKKDRSKSAATAKPNGLYLVDVTYPEEHDLPKGPLGPLFLPN